MRELVLDTETTGLDPKDGHRVIELACVELINYIPTGTSWHWYFNPQRDVPKASTDVHGLTAQFLADKPLFGDVAQEIAGLLAGARLIIHNAPFDMGFLNHEFGRLGLAPLSMEHVTDTLALARRKHPGSPNNLDALCRRYGIDNSTRTKHGALLDSELLADVYLRLIGAEQAGLDLTSRAAKARLRRKPWFRSGPSLCRRSCRRRRWWRTPHLSPRWARKRSGTGICKRIRRRRTRDVLKGVAQFWRRSPHPVLLPLGEGTPSQRARPTPSPMGRGERRPFDINRPQPRRFQSGARCGRLLQGRHACHSHQAPRPKTREAELRPSEPRNKLNLRRHKRLTRIRF